MSELLVLLAVAVIVGGIVARMFSVQLQRVGFPRKVVQQGHWLGFGLGVILFLSAANG